MKPKKMDSKSAINLVDKEVFAKIGRHLDELEEFLVQLALEDREYEEAVQDTPWNLQKLRNKGRDLWILLSGIFGEGEPVSKKRLRQILEKKTSTSIPKASNFIGTNGLGQTSEKILGGQPPQVPRFYGRSEELVQLRNFACQYRCIELVGVAGIGKSALAAKVMQAFSDDPQQQFNYLFWKPIYRGLPLQVLLNDLIQLLANVSGTPQTYFNFPQAKISTLLEYLRNYRCLIVMDGVENLIYALENNDQDVAEFSILLKRIAEEQHQSCLILTSREPSFIKELQKANRPVRSEKLLPLSSEDSLRILRDKNLFDPHGIEILNAEYRGNPMLLEAVADIIQDFFSGDIQRFLAFETTIDNPNFREMLDQKFGNYKRLNPLERQIMIFLAKAMENNDPVTFERLHNAINIEEKPSVSPATLLDLVKSLEQHLLIELRKDEVTGESIIGLEPLVKKYVLTDPSGLVYPSQSEQYKSVLM